MSTEQCLRALEQARSELTRREQLRPQQLTADQRERVLTLGRDLQRLWQAPSTSLRDKKELLRTLLEEVGVSVYREQYRALLMLRWRGGLLTECDVSLPRSRPAAVRTDEDTVTASCAGAVAGRGSHPLDSAAFSRRTHPEETFAILISPPQSCRSNPIQATEGGPTAEGTRRQAARRAIEARSTA